MEKYAYHILVPAVIIWLPLIIGYILLSIWDCFWLIEYTGKIGRRMIEKILNKVDDYIRYRPRLTDGYYRVAFILSYILVGIMIIIKINE